MPTKKKTKKVKNKNRFIEILSKYIPILIEKIKAFFTHRKVIKVGIGILITVFIALGFSFTCNYDSKKGFNCSTGYTPPDPDDVKKVLPNVGQNPKLDKK